MFRDPARLLAPAERGLSDGRRGFRRGRPPGVEPHQQAGHNLAAAAVQGGPGGRHRRREAEPEHPAAASEDGRDRLRAPRHRHRHLLDEARLAASGRPEDVAAGHRALPVPRQVHRDEQRPGELLGEGRPHGVPRAAAAHGLRLNRVHGQQ